MPAILTSNMSSLAATSFVDMLSAGESHIYLAIGGGAEHPWDNENIPPTPTDTLKDEQKFRAGIIGIKHVSIQNAMLMVPRVNWRAGMIFNTLSKTAIGPKKALDYYCITADNFVYQCVGKDSNKKIYTQIGGEPDLMIDDQHTIDGYTWKFLYDVTTQMVNEGMLLDAWMPVPYNKHGVYPGGTITESQNSYGDRNANWTLGAFRVLLTVELEDEAPDITYDDEFRQIGLIEAPRNVSGTLITGDTYASNEFDTNSGNLIYLENRKVIKRESGQTELLQVLLCF